MAYLKRSTQSVTHGNPKHVVNNLHGVLPSGVTGGSGLTHLGAVDSGSIGSSVTGYTGIKNFSQWYLNTSFGFTNGTNVFVSHWEEMQGTRGYTSSDVGGAMGGPSSGVWTFPSTGYWLVEFHCRGRGNSAAPNVAAHIRTTTNDSTYLDAVIGYFNSDGDPTVNSTNVKWLFDVTNVSTHKCAFATTNNVGVYFNADGVINKVGAMFTRLGDT